MKIKLGQDGLLLAIECHFVLSQIGGPHLQCRQHYVLLTAQVYQFIYETIQNVIVRFPRC